MKQLAYQIFQSWRTSGSSSPRFKWLPWGISIAAIGYVVYRLLQEDASTWAQLWPLQSGLLIATAMAFTLLPINWGLESEKWRMLIRRWYPDLTRPSALKSVFCGISTGIFTPNRIGEYPGRIMTLSPGYRWEAASAMLVDRLIQMVITLWLGGIALYVLEDMFPVEWQWFSEWIPMVTVLAVTLPMVVLIFHQRLINLIPGKNIGEKFRKALEAISLMDILTLLGLSLLRNATFTTQYLILLYGIGMTVEWEVALAMVWLIFFVKSFIPAWTITELGIRETIAIAVLGFVAVPASIAFAATFLLYIINLIIPALIGLRWVHNIKW